MFVAEVDFVPDLMINLARKEIVGEDDSGPDAVGFQGECGGSGQGTSRFRGRLLFVVLGGLTLEHVGRQR